MTDTTISAGEPTDLQRLDATLASLRVAESAVATMAAYIAETRNSLVAEPGDPEAARRVGMARLRMRGDAFALAQDFAALAQPEVVTP